MTYHMIYFALELMCLNGHDKLWLDFQVALHRYSTHGVKQARWTACGVYNGIQHC